MPRRPTKAASVQLTVQRQLNHACCAGSCLRKNDGRGARRCVWCVGSQRSTPS